jgi:acyl-coenzyme A thioesterase PaaI-like protein
MNSAATLAAWRADEARVRARLAQPGWARPDQLASRSGMQVFEAIFSGELPSPPIGATLDFIPVHIEPGVAIFQGSPQVRHYNPLGSVHGGWFATLLDSAVGCAVHSTLPAGKGYTTVELMRGARSRPQKAAWWGRTGSSTPMRRPPAWCSTCPLRAPEAR